MVEEEKILQNLSKYELYDKFNQNVDDTSKYVSYCKLMTHYTGMYPGILDVCYIFARNLITLPEILNHHMDNDERCRYFNFWITDKVRKLLATEWKDNGREHIALTRFLQVENSIKKESENNNCHFDYRSSVTLELWKERKDLHDYIRNYNEIQQRITSDGHMCTIYSKYFNNIKKAHDKYKEECCNRDSNNCPNLIKLDYFCTENNLFTKLTCEETKNDASASPEMSRNSNPHGQLATDKIPSAFPISRHSDDVGSHDLSPYNSNYYVKLSVGLSLLGIFSTIFYLYNFTTLGTWIRSKILRKNKINDNMDKDSQNLLEHESGNVDVNFYGDDFNIKYLPS
ncbi:PIR Superfamily Protein [Plasmodium ovale wallikeri]|uniref:PIR Superfamily Protein n=1 Tax=Plasmodium ovale wallikeri TaxID=864142 RepID=A0A1A9ASK8_PLAOA|nr:PIR Superfamily Protein [Plasmodium ovale wallikeri]